MPTTTRLVLLEELAFHVLDIGSGATSLQGKQRGCVAGDASILEDPRGLSALDLATLRQRPIALGDERVPRLLGDCATWRDRWVVPVGFGYGYAPTEVLVAVLDLETGQLGEPYRRPARVQPGRGIAL